MAMQKPIAARKKPIEIQTIRWTGDNHAAVVAFTGDHFEVLDAVDRAAGDDPEATAQIYDRLHSTWVLVYTGDWIIQGVKGELYPCRPDVFAETYELVTA
jgi:hypothetical protein